MDAVDFVGDVGGKLVGELSSNIVDPRLARLNGLVWRGDEGGFRLFLEVFAILLEGR
jgi:hypothetical protein